MSSYLYIDKYIPTSFEKINFNHNIAHQLSACSTSVNVPHMILKGCDGSGRKTFALLYIKEKYHLDKISLKHHTIEIKTGSKLIELQILYSDYHYQIEPSLHGVYDRVIVQGFIKDILQAKPISNIPYNIIIINNADRLTIEAQQSLRRTLEKNMGNCRFIFIVNQESTLIDSICSRCVQFRLAAPQNHEISSVLKDICQREKLPYNEAQLHQIAVHSERNMTRAMHILQYINLQSPKLLSGSGLIDFDQISINDKYINNFVSYLTCAQKPQDLSNLRDILYDLLVQCIEPIKILKMVFLKVFEYLEDDDIKKHRLIEALVKYESTLKQGSKPIYHIDAFTISIVNILNNYYD